MRRDSVLKEPVIWRRHTLQPKGAGTVDAQASEAGPEHRRQRGSAGDTENGRAGGPQGELGKRLNTVGVAREGFEGCTGVQ